VWLVQSYTEAMKAYPLLVKPFIIGPGTNKFVWLHHAWSGETQSADGTAGQPGRQQDVGSR
jgi:hypothetical protein